MSYTAKLKEMGYTLEPIELNAGRLMHAVRTGNLIYTSGQVSALLAASAANSADVTSDSRANTKSPSSSPSPPRR